METREIDQEACLDGEGCIILLKCLCAWGMYEVKEVRLDSLAQYADNAAAVADWLPVWSPYVNSWTGAFSVVI